MPADSAGRARDGSRACGPPCSVSRRSAPCGTPSGPGRSWDASTHRMPQRATGLRTAHGIPVSMSRDPVRVAIRVVVYIVLFIVTAALFGWVLAGVSYLIGIVATSLVAAGMANWLSLRIFEARPLPDVGLWWN